MKRAVQPTSPLHVRGWSALAFIGSVCSGGEREKGQGTYRPPARKASVNVNFLPRLKFKLQTSGMGMTNMTRSDSRFGRLIQVLKRLRLIHSSIRAG